jgi:hypothetical protein
MIDDAAHSVTQLEETVQKRDATVTRQSAVLPHLLDKNEEDRAYRQTTPISHEPQKSTKLSDPPIFEGKDVAAWLSRMKNKLKTNADHQLNSQRLPMPKAE